MKVNIEFLLNHIRVDFGVFQEEVQELSQNDVEDLITLFDPSCTIENLWWFVFLLIQIIES